ncbi:MAG: ABC transporter permease [Phycisphaerales bacterium]
MRSLPLEYAARNLARTPLRTLLAFVGSTLVLTLLLGVVGFVRGMSASLRGSGDDNILFIGAGSEESIERSEIPARAAGIVGASLGGLRTVLGQPSVSPEVHAALPVRIAEREDATDPPLVVVRGVTPMAFGVHPRVVLVEGRLAETGRDEVIAGRLAASMLGVERIVPGERLVIGEREVVVSGVFDAPGSVMAAELWMPLTDLQVLAQRDSVSCLVAGLPSDPATHAGLLAAAEAFSATRLDLELVAMPERDYYARLEAFFGPLRAMIAAGGTLVGLGALLGGLSTLHAAFASRIREFATLQVLGFRRGVILRSMFEEALLLNAAALLAASALALLLLDGLAIRFSMGLFGISIDDVAFLAGVGAAITIAFLGIALPAWRCLLAPIPEALRDG